MNKIKKKECIVCLKVFEYRTKSRGRTNKIRTFRGKNTFTCSKPCSKIYSRIAHHIFSKQRYQKLKSKKGRKIQRGLKHYEKE